MRLAKKLFVEHLRELAGRGLTLAEAAKEAGIGYAYLCTLASKHDITFKRQMMSERPESKMRAQDMRQRYEDGQTLEQIGQRYGLTRERVRQIMTEKFGTTGRDGGQSEMARRKRREFHKKREARCLKQWGCSYRQYHQILKHPDKPTYAYVQQRRNARARGIGWELSLIQWWKIWEASGHWNDRGRGRGYGMCRHRDAGPYAVDNVYIATCVENIQDHWIDRRERKAALLEGAVQ